MSLSVSYPAVSRMYPRWGPGFRETAPQRIVRLIHGDTQVPTGRCMSGNKFIRQSDFRLAALEVDVDIGSFGRNDFETACAVGRRRDLRRVEAMPLRECPCRRATPLWVGCIQNEVSASWDLRPTESVIPYTTMRKYQSVVACWETSSCDRAISVCQARGGC